MNKLKWMASTALVALVLLPIGAHAQSQPNQANRNLSELDQLKQSVITSKTDYCDARSKYHDARRAEDAVLKRVEQVRERLRNAEGDNLSLEDATALRDQRLADAERLDKIITQITKSQTQTQAVKDKIDDANVFTWSEILDGGDAWSAAGQESTEFGLGKAAEKVAEKALDKAAQSRAEREAAERAAETGFKIAGKAVGSSAAKKAVGPVGWILEGVELGLQKAMKEDTAAVLAEAVAFDDDVLGELNELKRAIAEDLDGLNRHIERLKPFSDALVQALVEAAAARDAKQNALRNAARARDKYYRAREDYLQKQRSRRAAKDGISLSNSQASVDVEPSGDWELAFIAEPETCGDGFEDTNAAISSPLLAQMNAVLISASQTTENNTRLTERPQYRVSGFDENLYDQQTANHLNAAIDRANQAVSACDQAAYQSAYEDWHGNSEWVGYEERIGQDGIVAEADAEREEGLAGVFLPTQNARDAEVIYRNRNTFPDYPKTDCGNQRETKMKIGDDMDPVSGSSDQPALSGSIMWAWESLDVPFAYLGYETGGEVEDLDDYYCDIQGDQDACDRLANAGSEERELSIVDGEEDLSLAGVTLGLDIPMGQWGRWSNRPSKIAVTYAEGDSTVKIGTVEAPASGARTLLPGPDGGETGASIANSGSFSSEISNAVLDLEAKKWAFGASIPVYDGPIPFLGGPEFEYDIYTAYRDIDWVAKFRGDLEAYEGGFAYRTEIEQSAWDLFLSAATEIPLTPRFGLKLEVRGGPSLYDFEATDMLQFDVFEGSTTGGGSSEKNGDSAFKLSGDVKVSALWAPGGRIKVGAHAEYGNTFVPMAHRDGTNPTTYSLEEKERVSVGFIVSQEF